MRILAFEISNLKSAIPGSHDFAINDFALVVASRAYRHCQFAGREALAVTPEIQLTLTLPVTYGNPR